MNTKQITLYIPEQNYKFFMELVESLSFVKKIETKKIEENANEDLLSGIKEAVRELNDIKAGKLKGINAKELLDEL